MVAVDGVSLDLNPSLLTRISLPFKWPQIRVPSLSVHIPERLRVHVPQQFRLHFPERISKTFEKIRKQRRKRVRGNLGKAVSFAVQEVKTLVEADNTESKEEIEGNSEVLEGSSWPIQS